MRRSVASIRSRGSAYSISTNRMSRGVQNTRYETSTFSTRPMPFATVRDTFGICEGRRRP